MASKKVWVNPYTVKGHHRIISERTFLFVCGYCGSESKRTTFATSSPKYCDKCKDIKDKKKKKQSAAGEVVTTGDSQSQASPTKTTKTKSKEAATGQSLPQAAIDFETVRHEVRQSLQAINSTPERHLASRAEIDRTVGLSPTPSAAEIEHSENNTAKSDHCPQLEDQQFNNEIVIEFINESLQNNYNKQLSSDEKYILVDLWNSLGPGPIANKRQFRIDAVHKITATLMEQLSSAFREKIEARNFRQVMEKHYRAYSLVQAAIANVDTAPPSTKTAKTGIRASSQSTAKSSKDNLKSAAIEELDNRKLVEYINELLLIHDEKKLTADAKNILIALWSGQNHEQIALAKNIKIKTIRKSSSHLMAQLSKILGESISPKNLRDAIDKHYRSFTEKGVGYRG